ncbi:NAD(P)H-dependent oxidoreductase [Qipengyuania flava]|jgi:FMN-dependent NADH-azoreductase|uniref:FMN-dependent NADH-azoreductase n=1 Tax=Qipengyuania flava TaxID=192812 RepID=UPI001AD9F01B|nr:NAD(P)H-dependent oxidoreductase [Qipengyuania flava]MBO9503794.1 NAD(P)H-dependent oxidoreductase [Qipengyuania flava]UOR09537.1 NAD(P)H-dependent oxidoreductase [Qipengyuania flava]
MTKILRIDASARASRSLTRALADAFTESWLAKHPDDQFALRDIGRNPPPFISEDWIAAAFAEDRSPAQAQLLAFSDELIGEVAEAEIIVLATPMYNYGMPAALKAWFDQVVRVGKTFSFDLSRGNRPLEPIFSGKTLVLLTSWGEFGFGPGELNEGRDSLTPHVRTASRYLGVDGFHHIGIEYQEFGDRRFETSREAAFAAIAPLVESLSGANSSNNLPNPDRAIHAEGSVGLPPR